MILNDVNYRYSPNGEERQGREVSVVVIHHISLPPGEFGTGKVEEFFTNCLDCSEHPFYEEIENVKVSAHFFIDRLGELTQFVDTELAAWHAGVSSFDGEEAVNLFSLGIELEGDEKTAYTDAQYDKLAELIRCLMEAYPAITPERVVGHDDIAPDRKSDPGPLFDWDRLRRAIEGNDISTV